MLQIIMAKAIAAEIGNVPANVDAVAQLLMDEAVGAETAGRNIADIYPRACAAALEGIALRLQELSEKILEEAELT